MATARERYMITSSRCVTPFPLVDCCRSSEQTQSIERASGIMVKGRFAETGCYYRCGESERFTLPLALNLLSAAGHPSIADVRFAFGGRSRLRPACVKVISEFFASYASIKT